jgi:hypothetical protein
VESRSPYRTFAEDRVSYWSSEIYSENKQFLASR